MSPSTLPIKVAFDCYRGDDWLRLFEPRTAAGPIDMTGWTGRMQVRDDVDGTVLITASTANGRIQCGPQSNAAGTTWQLSVYLSKGDTATFPAGFVGRYDIELTKPDGKKTTWYYDEFRVQPDITKEGLT